MCVAHRSHFHNQKQGKDFLEELGGALKCENKERTESKRRSR